MIMKSARLRRRWRRRNSSVNETPTLSNDKDMRTFQQQQQQQQQQQNEKPNQIKDTERSMNQMRK